MFIYFNALTLKMNRKRVYNIANVLLILVGFFFLVTSKATITGNVIGIDESILELRSIVGFLLLLIAGLMFLGSKHS